MSTIYIKFLSDFHISSGLGDGSIADSLILRDHSGIPYISGRALKGALREGAAILSRCRSDLKEFETVMFGTRSQTDSSNKKGALRVGSAVLCEPVYSALLKADEVLREQFVKDILCYRIQTALEDGQVKKGSLRTLECGIAGVTFAAEIDCDTPDNVSDEYVKDYLRAVFAAVKSIGGQRARGLGRCVVRFADDKEDMKISLPGIYEDK